jgi:hypothetical protein
MKLAVILLSCVAFSSARANIVNINFDEFTSPPVTCCYATTGVLGPLVYPTVTVVDGSGGGYVMNGSGWNNEQTSGNNLFGTGSGTIYLNFVSPVSNVNLDVINGESASNFTVNAYDPLNNTIFGQTQALNSFGGAGSVSHFDANVADIKQLAVYGNFDFAIDTVSFNTNTSTTPEPALYGILAFGMVLLGLARSFRKAKA